MAQNKGSMIKDGSSQAENSTTNAENDTTGWIQVHRPWEDAQPNDTAPLNDTAPPNDTAPSGGTLHIWLQQGMAEEPFYALSAVSVLENNFGNTHGQNKTEASDSSLAVCGSSAGGN